MRGKVQLLSTMLLATSMMGHAREVTYYLTDPNGSPIATMDANGTITSVTDYRPFGSPANANASPGTPGFARGTTDAETDLIYMGARFYDPSIGRFLSIDPVAPAPGRIFSTADYSYANNNPVSNSDPSGLYTCTDNDAHDCAKRIDASIEKMKSAERQLSGDKRAAIRHVLAALGPKGGAGAHGEQVHFSFGSLGEHTYGSLQQTGANSFEVTIDPAQQDSDFAADGPQYSHSTEVAATVMHEGQHVVDADKPGLQGRDWNATLLREVSAFQTQAYFQEGLRLRSHFLLFNPDLPAGESEANTRSAIVEAATADALSSCASRGGCSGMPSK